MEPTFFPTPADFRKWFEQNHDSADELWVGYYKKATKIPSITWPESVDQALCFGWIDGLRKSIDEKSYKIRFTPRRPTSHWSAVNIKRMAELKKEGLVKAAGWLAFEKRDKDNSARAAYEQKDPRLPEEYLERIRANEKAWIFFQSLAPGYKRRSIWYIISAKREETRQRRLDLLIESSGQGLKLPYLRKTK